MRRKLLLLLSFALVLPVVSHAWENEKTHPEITDAAVSRFADLDAFLRGTYGLRDGRFTRLAVQTGFDDAIDDDLFDGAGPGSRYTRNQTWLSRRPC